MYRYHAIIMSLGETQNHTRFSREVINDILANQPIVPVRINFKGDSIGSTIKYWEHPMNDKIECELDLKYPNLAELNLFVVPSGIVRTNDLHQDETGTTVIDKMQLMELSLTSFPADTSLTKLVDKPE